MTATFLKNIEQAVRSGLSVAAISRKYGYDNRAVRRAKARLYEVGAISKPVGYQPKDDHARYNT
jgi:transposase-like protein